MATSVTNLSSPVGTVATKTAPSRDAAQGQDFGSTLAREVAARQPTQAPSGKDTQSTQQDARDDAPEPGDAAAPWLALLQSMAQVVTQPLPQEEAVASEALPDAAVDPLAAAVTPGVVATLPATAGADPDAGARATGVPLLANVTADAAKGEIGVDEIAAHGKPLPLDLAASETDTTEATPAELLAASRADLPRTAETQPVTKTEKATPTHNVVPHVGESRWGDAVAQRVAMMIGKHEQKLEMQLNPPNLGPMDVQLTLAQDQASVVFASQHAAVREALAAATPRLTALLADQGIQLVNVQVASDSLNQHAQQQAQSGQDSGSSRPEPRGTSGSNAVEPAELRVDLGTRRLPVSGGGLSFYA
ncbi:flagellar hook-length control protein FliK [Jeongeupia naejangsanensis]|uniref:Flagellar hook-length control protein FliK n=1 Tax=Jeongeupia naejangsanensis TaxID=613195 RepID=A0ABS2BKR2_9NEIS|nr:flagellar hook-length control protein FliK [Jeongeupia naejangsanensis]MBM3116199.1 flagellar hook-length control protein FliK [Jeongeupia naejangsanensis]